MPAAEIKPGVKGLSQDHIDNLILGKVTLTDIAVSLGVTRQALSAGLKRRGVKLPSRKIDPEGAPKEPAPGPGPQLDAEGDWLAGTTPVQWAEYGRLAAGGLIIRVLTALDSGTLGPSALKALSSTLTDSLINMERLGVIGTPDSDQLQTLTVRAMTPAQEAAVRKRASRPSKDWSDD
jgi:hypothetical protein